MDVACTTPSLAQKLWYQLAMALWAEGVAEQTPSQGPAVVVE